MSSFTLRLIALALMFIDHAGLALFPALPALRWVGRLAFPLYCFLLAQGYAHTRDVRAYARRLLLFALLSEVPFDLLIFGRVACNVEQNALFSLLLALAAMALCPNPAETGAAGRLRTDAQGGDALASVAGNAGAKATPAAKLLGTTAGVTGLCMVAMLLRVSYGPLGIALCLCFHLLRGQRAMLPCAAGVLLLYTLGQFAAGVDASWALASLFALGALPLIALYSGRRGPRTRVLTFLFYAAYPAHLLALWLLRLWRVVPPYLFR